MQEDISKLEPQGIYSVCTVKKMIEFELVDDHFEFVYWIKGNPEQFSAHPLGNHRYIIYRMYTKEIVGKRVHIDNFAKHLERFNKRTKKGLKQTMVNYKTPL